MSTNLDDTPDGGPFATSGICDTCGLDISELTPTDAAAMVRSFPAMWRQVLAVHLDDDDPEQSMTRRPSTLGWSALEHAGHVRDVLHALDIRVQRILREDEPALPETHVTPPSGANEQGMAVVLAALTLSSHQFADTLATLPEGGLSRTGRRAGRTVSALDLVREAVHEGRHHLHLAIDTVGDARSTAGASA